MPHGTARPAQINDIDNATGEHFGVSGRAIRFDRADVFADLEVWKRDVDPKLWAASKPILMIGQMALSAAFTRTRDGASARSARSPLT